MLGLHGLAPLSQSSSLLEGCRLADLLLLDLGCQTKKNSIIAPICIKDAADEASGLNDLATCLRRRLKGSLVAESGSCIAKFLGLVVKGERSDWRKRR